MKEKLLNVLGYNENPGKSWKIFRTMTIVSVLMIWAITIFFAYGQFVIRHEVTVGEIHELNDNWTANTEYGGTQTVTLPCKLDVELGEDIELTNTIPDDVTDGMYMYIHAGRNFELYIGDECRKKHTQDDSEYNGKIVKSVYWPIELHESDRGKTIRIYRHERDARTGNFNGIMYGDLAAMNRKIIKSGSATIILAMILFLIAAGIIASGWIIRYRTDNDFPIRTLSYGVMLLSLWAICDSPVYQFFFYNYYVEGITAYLITTILPIPFIRYLNKIQQRRYEKFYNVLMGLQIALALACYHLHFLNIINFERTRVGVNIVLGIVCLSMVVTIAIDTKKKQADEYINVVIGIVILALCAVAELIHINLPQKGVLPDGIFVLVGLFCLLGMALFHSIAIISRIENERKAALNASLMKSTFLANMSHEIRTPINSIMGMNEMIIRESEDPNIREYAEYVDRSSRLLLGIVNDVLDFSRIEAGKINAEEATYDVAAMLRDLTMLLEEHSTQKNLRAIVTVDENIPSKLIGDRIHIQQIVINVISNAVKYTEEGSVTLSAYVKNKSDEECTICFRVSDTGIGMHKEDIEHIFESFSRFDEKRNKSIQGTGLGMAITRNLVKLLGGEIAIDSEYERGTTVTVEIPQKIKSAEIIGPNWKRDKKPTKNNIRNVTFTAPEAKILAVDDNNTNLLILKQYLKNTEVMLDMCNNGKEALDKCKENKYDLILLDHMMPIMDGIETIGRIKELEDNDNCKAPIIALTANAINGSREFYLENGFDDYITKPIEAAVFEEMIIKYLPRDKVKITQEEQDDRRN